MFGCLARHLGDGGGEASEHLVRIVAITVSAMAVKILHVINSFLIWQYIRTMVSWLVNLDR
jgi:hypothetical protein